MELNLGKKFRFHQKLDSIETKTEIEKGLPIVRWKEKERILHLSHSNPSRFSTPSSLSSLPSELTFFETGLT